MNLRGFLACASVVAMTTAAFAQAKPDFSGSWEPNREKTAAASAAGAAPKAGGSGGAQMDMRAGGGGGSMSMSGGGAPSPFVITQTAAALTISRDLGDGSAQKWVYKLDGTSSENTNGRTTMTTTSHWDAGKLVTEGKQATKTEQGDIPGTFSEKRWLDKDSSMHIETMRSVNGGAPTTLFQVLDKKK